MALRKQITRDDLKTKFGCANIFNYYFGPFQLGKAYNSRLRKDDKASTGFYVNEHGSILYNDLTTGSKYDFVGFVAALYGLSYYGAIQRIAADFGLTNGAVIGQKKPIIQPVHIPVKKPKPTFVVTTKPFSLADLAWWQQYSIQKAELVANNIYSVDSFTINEHRVYTDYNERKFCYLFKDADQNGYVKIYSPNSDLWKWAGNVKLSVPFGLNTTPVNTNLLVITKSVKDTIVLKKWIPDCIGLQNESLAALEPELMESFKNIYKRIVVFFDADKAGIKATNQYVEKYNIESVVIPEVTYIKFGVKDPADFIKTFGPENLEKFLRINKLIN